MKEAMFARAVLWSIATLLPCPFSFTNCAFECDSLGNFFQADGGAFFDDDFGLQALDDDFGFFSADDFFGSGDDFFGGGNLHCSGMYYHNLHPSVLPYVL